MKRTKRKEIRGRLRKLKVLCVLCRMQATRRNKQGLALCERGHHNDY